MKIRNGILLNTLAVSFLVPSLGLIAGCDSNAVKKESPAETQTRVNNAMKLRDFYTKSKGNYDNLSPEDKAAMNAQTGSEENSRKAMGYMGGGGPPH